MRSNRHRDHLDARLRNLLFYVEKIMFQET